jgi:hypothetical protein
MRIGSNDDTGESAFLSHLLQLDHWTFLLALVLVAVNVAVNARALSAVAALLLVVALVYDVYEFYDEE